MEDGDDRLEGVKGETKSRNLGAMLNILVEGCV